VTFGCDPLSGPPAEVVYQKGSGHGGDLTLVRLRRQGTDIEALRIAQPPYGQASSYQVERGSGPAASLDALLPEVNALLVARLEERVPADTMLRSGFFSTGDFHSLLRLEDADGHAVERAFTGYPSSEEQLLSIPMVEIDELLFPVVGAIHWESAPVDDDARAFFVSRYAAAGLVPQPRRYTWWVDERLVMLAEYAGTPALVPSLVELALATGEASVERMREEALGSLAVLAGFDARKNADGEARPIADVAADYARACRR
jgi:hypothetical protein